MNIFDIKNILPSCQQVFKYADCIPYKDIRLCPPPDPTPKKRVVLGVTSDGEAPVLEIWKCCIPRMKRQKLLRIKNIIQFTIRNACTSCHATHATYMV